MQRPRKAAAAAGKWEMRSEQASGSKWHLLLMRFFNELPAKQIPTKPGRPRPRTIPITTLKYLRVLKGLQSIKCRGGPACKLSCHLFGMESN